MFSRISSITIPFLLFLFLGEITFVNYLPDMNLHGSMLGARATHETIEIPVHGQFPNDRRKTAPEIRKYVQSFFRHTALSVGDGSRLSESVDHSIREFHPLLMTHTLQRDMREFAFDHRRIIQRFTLHSQLAYENMLKNF